MAAKKKKSANAVAPEGSAHPFSVKFYGADELAVVEEAAREAGLNLSAWAREVLRAVPIEEADEREDLTPTGIK